MTHKLKLLYLTIVFLCIQPYYLKSQERSREIGIQTDNDAYLWYGQDRYYTNGLFIFYRQSMDQSKLEGKKLHKIIYEVAVGQEMYNPYSGYAPTRMLHDRPFAGHLFAKGQLNLFYTNEQVLKVGLSLGTVGPNALAQQAQELLHRTFGFYYPDGWDGQIGNAVAVNLQSTYATLLFRAKNEFDISLEGHLNVGTTFSNVGIGPLFRIGNINPLYQSAHYNATISRNSSIPKRDKHEFYLYAKPQLRYVAYDATVQGSLFTNNSPLTFDMRPLVFEQKIGINHSSARFTIDYALTFRSKEIKSPARHHQYGSISSFYRF
ncbi:lipid A deacylase LpxR family protein [Sphingobacterium paludis]|uniref:Lipid A deacylase LpxR family protein n=1 Tax=Sphingobacterium paludis TaxID=1476465 RepID=A0A4R7CYU3_9SPHI|nr:lipid A deacylase LpxR family protein [Sphingobacterium paludis]TDS11686.1 hypothetical protein B0I21_10727 [Sphingobacterium paludis]